MFQIFVNIFLTLIIETLIFCMVFQKYTKIDLLLVVLVNIFTNVCGQSIFYFIPYNHFLYIVVELFVFIVEAVLFVLFFKRINMINFAIFSNLFTASIGFLLAQNQEKTIEYLYPFCGLIIFGIYLYFNILCKKKLV